MRFSLLIRLVTFVTLVTTGTINPAIAGAAKAQIVNGSPAQPHMWPTVHVLVGSSTAGKYAYCTATGIGPKVILAAAHCVDAGGLHGEVLSTSFLDEASRTWISVKCQMATSYASAPPSLRQGRVQAPTTPFVYQKWI